MIRLLNLKIFQHRVLGNLELDFDKTGAISEYPYISVIIGRNGIGKSQLFRAICEIFNYAYDLSTIPEEAIMPKYDFEIAFFIDGTKVIFSRKDLRKVSNKSKIKKYLPNRLIATSSYIVDKYPSKSNERYKYCGIRSENAPGQSSTKGLVRKTTNWILESLESKYGFLNEIRQLIAELGFEPRIKLTYNLRYKGVFLKGNLNKENLKEIFYNQREYFPKRQYDIWGTDEFKRIESDNQLQSIVNILNTWSREFEKEPLEIELLDVEDVERIKQMREPLLLLQKIGLLTAPSLTFYKQQDSFDFQEASSGENNLLCQLLSIMSNIRDNSIVLIDEPEQSCHPNWQINYIHWLRKIFKKYSDCHFIISTHSHFLLSDLNPEESSLMILSRDKDGKVVSEDFGDTPYCWSSDDILYRVFKVRNTRNYVFESRMMKLYDLLSSKANEDEVTSLVSELKRYALNEDDPLYRLLKMAENYHA